MLIGFCGIPGCGKSTAAKHLADNHGFSWINVGDPMKEMLRAFYKDCGLEDDEINRRLYGDLKREPDEYLNGKTPTAALQAIGYDFRDAVSPTLFVDRWADKAEECVNVVSDGMRYPKEEMPKFKSLGGILVRIVRPGLKEVTGHPAENQVFDPDIEILNAGSIEDFLRTIDGLVTAPVVPLRGHVKACA